MQPPKRHYQPMLLDKVKRGEIDPSIVVTQHMCMWEVPAAFKKFRDDKQQCLRIVLRP
jgi:threonine dehydrogenase-like Zn-dependent dehydrogenase